MHLPSDPINLPTRTPARSNAPAGERGFGLLELIIAMAIILILTASMLFAFGGAKDSAKSQEARGAAGSYDQAIAKFMSDNGNNRPTSADMVMFEGKPTGPRSLLNPAVGYLPRPPEGVMSGRIGVSMDGTTGCSGAPPATATQRGYIAYCTGFDAIPGYGIRVSWRFKNAWNQCWMGNTSQSPRCNSTARTP